MEATKNPEPSREDNNNALLEDSTTGKITCKMVQCHLCKDEYSETHMEFHLVGVHGVDGPKEMYIEGDPELPASAPGLNQNQQKKIDLGGITEPQEYNTKESSVFLYR